MPNFAGKSCRPVPVQGSRGFYRRRLSFSFSTRNIALKTVITSHLLALVGHVRAHGSKCLCLIRFCGASRRPLAGPFQCVEYLGFLPAFGPVFHLAGFPIVVHTFLGERCSDNIPIQGFSPRRRLYEPEASALLSAVGETENIPFPWKQPSETSICK